MIDSQAVAARGGHRIEVEIFDVQDVFSISCYNKLNDIFFLSTVEVFYAQAIEALLLATCDAHVTRNCSPEWLFRMPLGALNTQEQFTGPLCIPTVEVVSALDAFSSFFSRK